MGIPKYLLSFCTSLVSVAVFGQLKDTVMPIEKYDPKSTLVVKETKITGPKFPFIDVHNHLPNMPAMELGKVVNEMDKLNMKVMVNLSGRGFKRLKDKEGKFVLGHFGSSYLDSSIDNANKNYPGRFLVFTNIELVGVGEPGWTEKAVKQLEEDVRHGAKGLKVYKNLGLDAKDSDGKRIATDDPRLDAIWKKCGDLGIPVLIHTGEPVSFFDPHDEHNERWLELKEFPDRARPADKYPPWKQVMEELNNIIRKNPKTIFIEAHMAWLGNDLTELGKLLDAYPNMYTEIAAVVHELGRQPITARNFFIKYQDRILFGKDVWAPEEYLTYFRILETTDEYFPYYRRRHAFWRMYGLGLPDDVLKKIYYKNALKIFKFINPNTFPK